MFSLGLNTRVLRKMEMSLLRQRIASDCVVVVYSMLDLTTYMMAESGFSGGKGSNDNGAGNENRRLYVFRPIEV